MNRATVAVLSVSLLFGSFLATPVFGEDRPYVNLVLRACECNKEITIDRSKLIHDFNRNSRMLDSLLSVYDHLDTLSGWIGLERVFKIAVCYTDLAMYEDARDFWSILSRRDGREYFKKEIHYGLLRAGVELGDSLLLSSLLDSSELWRTSIKRELGEYLMLALDFLHSKKADRYWLEKRFMRLKRFLPEFDATLLESELNSERGKWGAAYGLNKWLLERISPSEIEPAQANRFLEGLYRTALLSGRLTEAEQILDCVLKHGNDPLASRARLWSIGAELLGGKLDRAEEQYRLICKEKAGAESSCFWQDFIGRYKEVSANVQ